MALAINTNVSALTAYRNLAAVQRAQATAVERLSSGLRINRAADDAAGLAIAQRLTSSINGLGQAIRNAQDGINLLQTADGGLTETHAILQRMRTLAVQAANDSNDAASRSAIGKEITQLNKELDRIASTSEFNGQKLLNGALTASDVTVGASGSTDKLIASIGTPYWGDGTPGAVTTDMGITLGIEAGTNPGEIAIHVTGTDGTDFYIDDFNGPGGGGPFQGVALGLNMNNNVAVQITFGSATLTAADIGKSATLQVTNGAVAAQTEAVTLQIGANAGETLDINAVGDMSSATLGTRSLDLSSAGAATAALDVLDRAIQTVSTGRANLGAYQNRLQHTINNISVAQQNLLSSRSSITDTDMAAEMAAYTRTNILAQAGMSMLRQANQSAQNILTLLQ